LLYIGKLLSPAVLMGGWLLGAMLNDSTHRLYNGPEQIPTLLLHHLCSFKERLLR